MRLRIDLAYDGTDFKGWARQPGLRTVQAELETALDTVLRRSSTSVTCAGRTDTGVHARGQVAHVDLSEEVLRAVAGRRAADAGAEATEVLARRLNGLLPDDVRIRRVVPAASGFDARFSALWRRYAYRIDDSGTADPLARGHVLSWPRPLDLDAMNTAAAPLLGEHDFAAFCKRREGATTVRRVLALHVGRLPEGLVVATVQADAFCHHMVRSLMGCLVRVGEGRREPAWVREILRAGRRDPAVPVLAAHGLVLEEVRYPPDDALADQADATRRVRGRPEPAEGTDDG
ncbi:tRNA pseudouridine(38-40) synthase TruA [Nocardioides donggukensis]|uniref:tRNA pseudouridine(38-40) synthase TruA n=1 Tax=Nocardioides donggukensis TaxID=2774019 RepID=UPI00298BF0CF|nr:tRNA pseudouridine(38-40) synthase TruA [Nocardioides donggukensis]